MFSQGQRKESERRQENAQMELSRLKERKGKEEEE